MQLKKMHGWRAAKLLVKAVGRRRLDAKLACAANGDVGVCTLGTTRPAWGGMGGMWGAKRKPALTTTDTTGAGGGGNGPADKGGGRQRAGSGSGSQQYVHSESEGVFSNPETGSQHYVQSRARVAMVCEDGVPRAKLHGTWASEQALGPIRARREAAAKRWPRAREVCRIGALERAQEAAEMSRPAAKGRSFGAVVAPEANERTEGAALSPTPAEAEAEAGAGASEAVVPADGPWLPALRLAGAFGATPPAVLAPRPALMLITVPEGVRPGQVIGVPVKGGCVVDVALPAGAWPGRQVRVEADGRGELVPDDGRGEAACKPVML
jgi:hypothetical protein